MYTNERVQRSCGLGGCFDGFLRITFGCDDYRGGGGRLSCSKEAESLSYMVRVCVAALFLPGTFESPESVVAALFLPSSLRSLWSPHCSYLRVSMYHNGVASSRPPGASLRIARHSILVVVLPFRSQQEEPRDESFPCHSEVSVRYRTRSSRFFPAVLGQARPPFDLGRCRCLYAVFLRPQASSLKPQGGA